MLTQAQNLEKVKRDRTLLSGSHANTLPPIIALLSNSSWSLSEQWSKSLSAQFLKSTDEFVSNTGLKHKNNNWNYETYKMNLENSHKETLTRKWASAFTIHDLDSDLSFSTHYPVATYRAFFHKPICTAALQITCRCNTLGDQKLKMNKSCRAEIISIASKQTRTKPIAMQ